jgi:hypothetical protein
MMTDAPQPINFKLSDLSKDDLVKVIKHGWPILPRSYANLNDSTKRTEWYDRIININNKQITNLNIQLIINAWYRTTGFQIDGDTMEYHCSKNKFKSASIQVLEMYKIELPKKVDFDEEIPDEEMPDEEMPDEISVGLTKEDAPQQFAYLYANDKAPGQSLDEKVDLSTTEGHVLRDSKSGKFLFFENYRQLTIWFNDQKKPYIHSIINKHRPIRFNLELDITNDLLKNIVFKDDVIKQIEKEDLDVDHIKALKSLENVRDSINDILEEHYQVEPSDYVMHEASDNREGKYSYRIYMKLAFANMIEYKYFITLLKAEVKPVVLPMIDPTSLMLRTPGSWKDNHQCKWTTPGCSIEHALLSYTDDCDALPAIAPEETKEEYDETTSDDIKKAVSLLATHEAVMGNFYFTGEDKGMLKYKRSQPSHCGICDRTHDTSDAYATIYKGHVYLRCYRDDTKGSVYIGFIGEKEVLPVKFGAIKKMMRDLTKAQEKLEQTGMSNKEKTQLGSDQARVFEEAKKAAKENDDAVAKIDSFYYTDFLCFHEKTFSDIEQFNRYVKQSIVKIMMGGNSLYITSDAWSRATENGRKQTKTKHFTETSITPCSTKDMAYWFSIINPDFEASMPLCSKKNPMFLRKKFGDLINDYTMRHFYKSVDFMPYLIPPTIEDTEIFNLFEGFRFPFIELSNNGEQKEPLSVIPWINHIHDVVCSGNAEAAKTIIQWLAHIIQKPTEKSFAIILFGGQGTGKSILYEFFTRCIGKDLGLQVGKLEDLTQTHNTHLRGKLIINANEATNEPCIRDVNILKGLITETDLIINPKNVNQYTVSNFSRLMITSNYKHCMRLDKDDRRYFCLQISDNKKNNDDYFAPLIDGLTNENTQRDFFNYLANYDLSDFKHQRPPITKMKRDLIESNVSNLISFIKDICENNLYEIPFEQDKDEIFVSLKDLYREYDLWCRHNDTKGRKSSREALHEPMHAELGVEKTMGPRPARARGFTLNRAAMLPHFRTAYAKPNFEYVVAE